MAHFRSRKVFVMATISLAILFIYFDRHKQEIRQPSAPITTVNVDKPEFKLQSNALRPKTSRVATPTLSPHMSAAEQRVLTSFPMRSQFDVEFKESVIDCDNNNCSARLFYRVDVSKTEKNDFMNYIQSDEGTNYMKSKGLIMTSMSFGFDRNIGRDYFEVLLDNDSKTNAQMMNPNL